MKLELTAEVLRDGGVTRLDLTELEEAELFAYLSGKSQTELRFIVMNCINLLRETLPPTNSAEMFLALTNMKGTE